MTINVPGLASDLSIYENAYLTMCDEICVFNAEASSPDAVVCTLGSILAESTPCQKALDVLEG